MESEVSAPIGTPLRFHRKAGGNILMIRSDGRARFLSLIERLRYLLFGTIPADALIAALEPKT